MSKKLIICADGTGNTQEKYEDGKPCPTHVARIARALRTEDADGRPQVIFYEAGVGTQNGLKLRGGALGRGVWANILDCYRFLVYNYSGGEPGKPETADKIYIFGFSRGSFIARSLAGLIRNSGLLKRGHEDFEREALELYRDPLEESAWDSDKSKAFRTEHSHDPDIEFMGLWDTVGSLGLSFLSGKFHFLKELNYDFHDIDLSDRVKFAYHACAIHERRTKFGLTRWTLPKTPRVGGQVLEQVWFAGVHSDAGGGYIDHALGDCSIEWMIEKAEKCGLRFGRDSILDVKKNPLGTMNNSFIGGFRFLDTILFRPSGTPRACQLDAAPNCESIHESARQRFRDKPDEWWPPSFRQALAP